MKRMSKEDIAAARTRLLTVMTRHVGRGRMIGMAELYTQVFERGWDNRINDTRAVRKIVTALRREGVPIMSVVAKGGGGYYLAAGTSEIEEYVQKLRVAGLKKLRQAAAIKGMSLPAFLGQMELDLQPKRLS